MRTELTTPVDDKILAAYRQYLLVWNQEDIALKLEAVEDFLSCYPLALEQIALGDITGYREQVSKTRRDLEAEVERLTRYCQDILVFWRFIEEKQEPMEDPYKKLSRYWSGYGQPLRGWVEDYSRWLRRRGDKPQTIEQHLVGIRLFVRWLPEAQRECLEGVDTRTVEGYVEWHQDRGYKPSTINLKLRQLSCFFDWCCREGYVSCNPVSSGHFLRVEQPLPRPMRKEDVVEFLSVVEDVEDRAMFLLMLRTGIRVGELLDLRMSDLDLADRRVLIREGEKTHKGRSVYLSDDALEALEAWLEKRKDYQVGCVFFPMRGRRGRYSYSGLRQKFHRYCRSAGVDGGYTPHCLRHTFATELLDSGMGLEVLQVLMGHSEIRMTERYARISPARAREVYFETIRRVEERERSSQGVAWGRN